jgi:hypothetical protein
MKKLFLLGVITLLSVTSILGQTETLNLPIDSLTGKITYTEVVSVDTLSNKQELFSRAREWFAKAYKSSKSVIQMEDKESGKIVGKALMPIFFKYMGLQPGGNINYTISVYLKDGKYKYEITDFYHTGLSGNYPIPDGGACENLMTLNKGIYGMSYKNTYGLYLFQMDENIKALVFDLKTAMKTKATNTKKEDW